MGKEKLATSAGSGKLAIAERHISEKASKAIAKVAFDLAVERSKKRMQPGHVTIVHKANVLRLSEGLFLESCQEVAKNYPDVVVGMCVLRIHLFSLL